MALTLAPVKQLRATTDPAGKRTMSIQAPPLAPMASTVRTEVTAAFGTPPAWTTPKFVAALATGQAPLVVALLAGGILVVLPLARKLLQREFGSDHLAGISIVTSVFLG